MATLITKENYAVDNTRGLLEASPVFVRHFNELVTDVNVGGSFYSTANQTVAVINTAYVASLNNTVYATGMSIDAATNKIITVTAAGTYSFDFTMQVNKNEIVTSSGNLTAWLTVNGVAQAYTANKLGFAITTGDQVMTLHSHLVLNAGDQVSLNYAADYTALSLKTSAASAPYPAIASISLEIDKVR
jgi:NAD/NADP transhydrogenase alpha subunit